MEFTHLPLVSDVLAIVSEDHLDSAQQLAKITGYPCNPKEISQYKYVYHYNQNEQRLTRFDKNKRVDVDLNLWGKKRKQSGLKNNLLARSIGLKQKTNPPVIIDMTTGLGRDARVFIELGCEVHCIERSYFLYHLLLHEMPYLNHKKKLSLHYGDSRLILKNLIKNQSQCVLYLDPMFEIEKPRKALPKKETQFLLHLFKDIKNNEQELMTFCFGISGLRIVLKRPLKGGAVYRRPNLSFKGHSVRYDVFFT